MAQRTIVQLIDDVDGSEATETVSFGIDGVRFEIELSGENSAQIRADFSKWSEVARRVSGRSKVGTPKRKGEAAKVRVWALKNGIELNVRGRIPADIQRRYDVR